MQLDLITALALQAADDPAACPVLGDALLEYGAPLELAAKVWEVFSRLPAHVQSYRILDEESGTAAEVFFRRNATATTPTFARALAAVLLCREWQTVPWWESVVWTFRTGQQLDEAFGAGSQIAATGRYLLGGTSIPGTYVNIIRSDE